MNNIFSPAFQYQPRIPNNIMYVLALLSNRNRPVYTKLNMRVNNEITLEKRMTNYCKWGDLEAIKHVHKRELDQSISLQRYLPNACRWNKASIIYYMLKHGGYTDTIYGTLFVSHPATCLSIITGHGDIEVMRYMISLGANIGAWDNDAYYRACRKGQLKAFKLLNGYIPLRSNGFFINNYFKIACEYGHLHMAKWMSKQMIIADIVKYGNEALYNCCLYNHLRVIKWLVRQGVYPNPDNIGNVITGMCCHRSDKPIASTRILKYLIRIGVDINTAYYGAMAMILSAESGYYRMVKFLLRQGIDVHVYNDAAVCMACCGRYLNADLGIQMHIIRLLVKHGANIHVGTEEPLFYAIASGNLPVVKYLVQLGADIKVNRVDRCLASRRTPQNRTNHLSDGGLTGTSLMVAIRYMPDADIEARLPLIEYLVECGADYTYKTVHKMAKRYPVLHQYFAKLMHARKFKNKNPDTIHIKRDINEPSEGGQIKRPGWFQGLSWQWRTGLITAALGLLITFLWFYRRSLLMFIGNSILNGILLLIVSPFCFLFVFYVMSA